MSTSDGGPAFPTKHPALDPRASGFHTVEGMSLRDYFAAKAMQGDWAAQDYENTEYFSIEDSDGTFHSKAKLYYRMADAMLKARQDENAQDDTANA